MREENVMKATGAIALGFVLAMPVQAADKITVTPVELVETRAKQFKQKVKFAAESELKLTLYVEGDKVNDATSYGKIEFDEVADDAGGDLKPKKKKGMFSFGGGGDEFTSLRNGQMGMRQEKGEDGFRMELKIAASSRKATKISRLKGQFQVLAGGEKKTVAVKKVKSHIGKKIEDPALKAAGLEVRIVDPKKKQGGAFDFGMGGGDSLPIEFKGDLNVLQEVEIVDAAGKSVTSGYMSTGSDDKKTYSYDLKKPLDDKMTVKIELMVGLKTITVPFDLKDIELP